MFKIRGRQRVKLILAVEEGPWLVKKAFIKKPMLHLGSSSTKDVGGISQMQLSSNLLLALYQGFVNYCSASFTTSPTIIWRSRLNERLVRQLAARLQW